jgi:predicted TIM-barrel fold metal-dependent hydrolase
MSDAAIGTINARRLLTPGADSWDKSVRPDDPDRHLIITIDSHVSEPEDLYKVGGIDPKYYDRLPRMIFDEQGRQFLSVEGLSRPLLVKGMMMDTDKGAEWERDGADQSFIAWSDRMEPDDLDRLQAGATKRCDEPTLSRLNADMSRDGVDGAVLFANRGLMSFATQDTIFQAAMCRAFNSWAAGCYGPQADRFKVAAQIPTADVDLAIAELEWAARNGFTCVNFPSKPIYGPRTDDEPHYNHPKYDRVYAAVQDLDLTLCLHVGSGKDPRAAHGSGGAIVNGSASFLASMSEPLAMILACGAFERFPKLRLVTVEAEVGWIPWLLQHMDLIYYKHHMWARPYGERPPSEYWRSNCYASFIEDNVGLELAKSHNFLDNILWSNDYPHNEGSWPHSQQAIERELQAFSEEERAKILGLNATKLFGFDAKKLLARRELSHGA